MGRKVKFTDPAHVLRRLYKRRDYARRHGKPLPELPGESAGLERLRKMAITPQELAACGVELPPKAQEGGR